jgi:GT2 family glycosyltransferase
MQPRVTAILVARNGADYLEKTLPALDSQTRRPDAIVLVDAGSSDTTSTLLFAANPNQLVTTPHRSGFGEAVASALHTLTQEPTEDDWIWLLAHDSAPDPDALATLLGAVEIAPSVAIAGPKLMRWDRPDTIAEYGETVTRFGASILLVENELDQSQYDTQSDLLAVAAAGMLVRRSVWTALGGFDPGLPTVDAALDFSIRVRLAGFRVVGVPGARVASAGGPELFGRRSVSVAAANRTRRAAQLHRRMVYSSGGMLPFHWLSLVPLSILRSIWQLLSKRPGAIGGELSSAFSTAFSGTIGPARRKLRRTRKLGWGAIAPLRISSSAARERRVGRRPAEEARQNTTDAAPRTRAGFVAGGGAWVVLLTAVIGVLAFSPLLGATAVAGGGLLPLSPSLGELWSHVGYGWHDVGGGFIGASDPFAAVLAVLGSITFWAPSFSIVLVYLAALPIAALGAWWCATRLSERAWPPAIAALLWSLAPPFLSSMTTGHLGAVIAHILLPWLVLATLSAARNWSAGAGAALLFAAVAASAPSLAPALVVLLLAWAIARPWGAHRVIGILIPAAVLFAPLVITQIQRGNPLAVLADPGLAVTGGGGSPLELTLGSPDSSLGGWTSVGEFFNQPSLSGPIALAILLAPFALLALAGAFLPGTRRSIPSLVVALLGFVTAVAATHLTLTSSGSQPVSLWPGAGLSLFWLGLTGAGVVALDAFRRASALPALIVAIASALAVAPLLSAPLTHRSDVVASSGSLVPAYVEAQAASRPRLGTLVLTPQSDGGLDAGIERGEGGMLDDQATLVATSSAASRAETSLAMLAGNVASRSGLDTAAAMKSQKVGFVLLTAANGDGESAAVYRRAADALDGNPQLAPVGDTSLGVLWRFGALPSAGLAGAEPTGGEVQEWILGALAVVFFVTLLFAIPTSRRRRNSAVRADRDEHATLGEDDDD